MFWMSDSAYTVSSAYLRVLLLRASISGVPSPAKSSVDLNFCVASVAAAASPTSCENPIAASAGPATFARVDSAPLIEPAVLPIDAIPRLASSDEDETFLFAEESCSWARFSSTWALLVRSDALVALRCALSTLASAAMTCDEPSAYFERTSMSRCCAILS